MPHRKSLASIWRRIPERYRGESTYCANCGRHFFPLRNFCPDCRRKSDINPYRISGKGRIYTYSVVHVPQEGFELDAPYAIGIIELEEGARITAQICDAEPESLCIGMPVELAFRKVSENGKEGIIHYSYKFKPIS